MLRVEASPARAKGISRQLSELLIPRLLRRSLAVNLRIASVMIGFLERLAASRLCLSQSVLIVRLSHCEWRDSCFWAQRRDAFVPFCGLLIGVSEREDIDFREMRPTDLQSNGEAILRKTTWY